MMQDFPGHHVIMYTTSHYNKVQMVSQAYKTLLSIVFYNNAFGCPAFPKIIDLQ